MTQILTFVIVVALGITIYRLINKRISITWSKIIGIWAIGLVIIIFGAKLDIFISIYIGFIIWWIDGLLIYGKIFNKIISKRKSSDNTK